MRGSAKVLAVLAAMAALMVAAPIAQAAFPGENGKIAFVRYGERSNAEIHTVNPDGTGLQRLSNYDALGEDTVFDFTPTWSRDGTKLAFVRTGGGPGGITVMNADGTDRRLLADGRSPAWSPDGTQIAFGARTPTGPFGSTPDIYKVNVDGTGLTILASSPDNENSPSWSPDGRIAFHRDYIWIMNGDGSGKTRTEGGGPGVQWSPDGSKIAFFNAGLSTMDADGTDARIIAPRAYEFDWSPDGHKLAFTAQDNQGGLHIYTVNPDGSDLRELRSGSTFAHYPAWSPDGSKIAFGHSGGLSTMNSADGGDVTRITTNPFGGSEADLDWQPLPAGPRRSDYKNTAQFCKAEREFLGDSRFRQKYGGGGNAHGKCVSGK